MGTRSVSWSAVLAAIAVLVVAAPPSGAGSVRLGGVFGMANQAHGDVNDIIGDTHRTFDNAMEDAEDYYDYDFDENELGSGLVLGAKAEYLISDNLGLGVEFQPLSSSGGYDASYSYWDPYDEYDVDYDEDAEFEATGSLIAAYGFYRMPMGDVLHLRLGGGLDYVLGGTLALDEAWRAELYDQYDYDEYDGGARFEATGSGFGFHALAGAEYQIGESFLIVGDAAYRFVKIDELEVQDASTWMDGEHHDWEGMEEGEILQWVHVEEDGYDYYYFSTEDDGKKVGLDFSGLYLTLGAYFCF